MLRVACVHGLGGSASTMQPLVDSLCAAGHDAWATTLPGHGTAPDDLAGIGWAEWLAAVPDAEVLVGQSMGAALALAAAAARPAVRAVVAINPPAADPDALDGLDWRRSRGVEWVDAPAAADGEAAYERLPIESLIAMAEGLILTALSRVRCPVLVVTSLDDDVVDPAHSDVVAASVSGPVERLALPLGGHTATRGPERAALTAAVLAFLTHLSSP